MEHKGLVLCNIHIFTLLYYLFKIQELLVSLHQHWEQLQLVTPSHMHSFAFICMF